MKKDGLPALPPRTGSIWRKAGMVLAGAGIALLLTTLIATLLLRLTGDARHALLALQAARPWLSAVQIGAIGLLWHCWPALVARSGRRLRLGPDAESALLRLRPRIVWILAAFELLIVLRALAG